jgi:hypothetical protein
MLLLLELFRLELSQFCHLQITFQYNLRKFIILHVKETLSQCMLNKGVDGNYYY